MPNSHARIGFVSTRLAGTDGVSLEVRKWTSVLDNLGHECFYFAGESEWPAERSYVVPQAHFKHPEIEELSVDLFDDNIRNAETSKGIDTLKFLLKDHLHRFVRQFDINLLIVENALSIPMNVPLGLALTELIAETSLPTIGHHHDFAWERPRFLVNAAEDYLNAAFPATLRSVFHVVINSYAQRQLALRSGASSVVIPNVMDFDAEPPQKDGDAAELRKLLGFQPGEYFLLQPTRVVPRKRIERAIGLARRLEVPCKLVISHESGDEGAEYFRYLQEMIELFDVQVIFAHGYFGGERGRRPDGSHVYSLADAYLAADLVTYPSAVEGFGNAFLEAIYYCRPLVVSTYEIYRLDIKPKGFNVIEFGEFVTDETVVQVRELLADSARIDEITARNYAIARRHYSYTNLEVSLAALIAQCRGDGRHQPRLL